MSEPSYLSGDDFANSNAYESTQEVECAECGQAEEVSTQEDYAHGTVTWYAEWTCKCGESNTAEGWYDANHTD